LVAGKAQNVKKLTIRELDQFLTAATSAFKD
jgi:hypothetical protein